ncbi:hypothetical protein GCM10009549_52870 [Streptomyces thermoalcalitolerans]|uniref:Uncharacterized protein n=1 Tax=Streptomyces thermoalcalitolerans TaxID=65605 RepID=A0ABN1PL57_9ACTN
MLRLNRTKIFFITGIALTLTLAAGLAYTFKLPPFKKRGEIRAEDVCASLGNASRAATALTGVLPEKSSYSFQDNATDLRTDESDDFYQTACFVYGDGKQLLVARTDMLEYETTERWQKEAVEQFVSASSILPFAAGDKAVASDKIAAIYVPCASHGIRRHLSVVVRLKKQGDASASDLRAKLIDLAENAAVHAHMKAKCDRPSKLRE